jgi:hypothetical protein
MAEGFDYCAKPNMVCTAGDEDELACHCLFVRRSQEKFQVLYKMSRTV